MLMGRNCLWMGGCLLIFSDGGGLLLVGGLLFMGLSTLGIW